MLQQIQKYFIYSYALLIPIVTSTRFVGFSFGRSMVILFVGVSIVSGLFFKERKINNRILLLIFMYVSWMILSLLWTPDVCLEQGMIRTGFTIIICLFYVFICTYGFTEDDLNIIKKNLTLGGVLSAIVLIFFGGDYYGDEEEVRYSLTPKTDPNFYSMYLLVPLSIIFNKFAKSQGYHKIILFSAMAIVLYAIVLCGSRGAMLAIIIMLALELIIRRKIIFLAFFLIFLYMAFQNISAIYPRFEMEALASGAGRSLIWAVIIEMIKDNPVFGVGVSGIKGAYDDYAIDAGIGFLVGHGRDPHNAYLEILAELGIVGFILYMAIVCYSFFLNFYKREKFHEIYIGVIGTFIAATFLTSILEEPIWFYLAIMATSNKPQKAIHTKGET